MYQNYTKRLLDFLSAIVLVTIFLPVGSVLAVIIKLDSKGPVIFKQKRYGQHGKIFTIYKFRTMRVGAPNDHPTNNLKNPERYITRSGKIMRKLSLDELPQLINVVKGDMSMVGPRPVILKETDLIAERAKYNANAIKPGITGWAQVNGRDEVRIAEKARMDGEYAANLSFIMDMKCVALTVWAVLSVKGHREGAADGTPSRPPEAEREVANGIS